MAEERINKSTSSDQAEFALRCTQFLDQEGAFKLGFIKHGESALTLLRQMYRIKVFKLYLKKDKEKAKKFIDDIDALGETIQRRIKTLDDDKKNPDPNILGTPAFKEIDKSFDDLVANYYLIESECGV